MSEKKEKQYVVLLWDTTFYYVKKAVWFDSRQVARDYVKSKPTRLRYRYSIMSMTRGPKA